MDAVHAAGDNGYRYRFRIMYRLVARSWIVSWDGGSFIVCILGNLKGIAAVSSWKAFQTELQQRLAGRRAINTERVEVFWKVTTFTLLVQVALTALALPTLSAVARYGVNSMLRSPREGFEYVWSWVCVRVRVCVWLGVWLYVCVCSNVHTCVCVCACELECRFVLTPCCGPC